jgi:signal peptidase I
LVNVIHTYGMEVTMCLGPSMLPTFNHRGDVVLMERVSVLVDGVENGDVVIARSPANPKHTVCKRVLGRQGDHIEVPTAGNFGGSMFVKVPKGHLWLQGGQQR